MVLLDVFVIVYVYFDLSFEYLIKVIMMSEGFINVDVGGGSFIFWEKVFDLVVVIKVWVIFRIFFYLLYFICCLNGYVWLLEFFCVEMVCGGFK